MRTGVQKVVCTCGEEMKRTGGVWGELISDTYYCAECRKHVVIITPKEAEQKDFSEMVSPLGG